MAVAPDFLVKTCIEFYDYATTSRQTPSIYDQIHISDPKQLIDYIHELHTALLKVFPLINLSWDIRTVNEDKYRYYLTIKVSKKEKC